MGRRLILDTNVLMAYERGTIDRVTLDATSSRSRRSRWRNTGLASN